MTKDMGACFEALTKIKKCAFAIEIYKLLGENQGPSRVIPTIIYSSCVTRNEPRWHPKTWKRMCEILYVNKDFECRIRTGSTEMIDTICPCLWTSMATWFILLALTLGVYRRVCETQDPHHYLLHFQEKKEQDFFVYTVFCHTLYGSNLYQTCDYKSQLVEDHVPCMTWVLWSWIQLDPGLCQDYQVYFGINP